MPALCASVVIPAHNEEAVVGRCLERLAQSLVASELEVIVVANGCTDGTVEAASAYADRLPHLVVLDEPRPGKIGALNRGDAVATTFPRVYLDADIEVEPGTLERLLERLDSPAPVVAAPAVRFDTAGASPLVMSYYRVFATLPYVTDGLVGLGLYAFNAAGRARFGRFPELTADDLFVQRIFAPEERVMTPGAFIVRTPRTLRDLLRVRRRVAAGNVELAVMPSGSATGDAALDTAATASSTAYALVATALRRPSTMGAVLVYVAVTLVARMTAGRAAAGWMRDESSRRPATGEAFLNDRKVVEIDGVNFDRMTEPEVVNLIFDELAQGRGGLALTPNVDILRQLRKPAAAELAPRAAVVVADGMPIVWASQLLGTPLPERVTGSSLVWSLCDALAERGGSTFLLGAAPGVAERAAAALTAAYPSLEIRGCLSPPHGFDKDPTQLAAVVDEVETAQPDIVLVALGFPKQEWVALALFERLPATWFLGCGGSLDMAAGDVRRAPGLAQAMGVEWIIRLAQEPRRLARRYLIDDVPYAVGLLCRAAVRRLS